MKGAFPIRQEFLRTRLRLTDRAAQGLSGIPQLCAHAVDLPAEMDRHVSGSGASDREIEI